ncbi:uncharacterized protein LOC144159882 [Haemaphysalis longicornis]
MYDFVRETVPLILGQGTEICRNPTLVLSEGCYGHGGTAEMKSNPFVFLAQLLTTLLLIRSAQDGRSEPQRGNTTQLVAESRFGVSAQHMCQHSGYRHGSPTAATISVDAVCGGAQGALLAPSIYAARASRLDNGHGGNAEMKSNPFVFLAQVRKRYGKCYRSNDLCLLVLPCPRLLCLFLYDLSSHVVNVLLLAGDVETNPGPDLAYLAKQLQAIAGDLK